MSLSKSTIIINNSIYQYTSDSVKILAEMNLGKLDLLKSTIFTNIEDNILVINLSENSRSGHSWTKLSGWHYDGSDKRYSLDIHGVSSNSMSLMSCTYYAEAKGQQKKWGSWTFRNSYNPIYSVSGNWDYSYVYTRNNGRFYNREFIVWR
jgi:hypothetical protein